MHLFRLKEESKTVFPSLGLAKRLLWALNSPPEWPHGSPPCADPAFQEGRLLEHFQGASQSTCPGWNPRASGEQRAGQVLHPLFSAVVTGGSTRGVVRVKCYYICRCPGEGLARGKHSVSEAATLTMMIQFLQREEWTDWEAKVGLRSRTSSSQSWALAFSPQIPRS